MSKVDLHLMARWPPSIFRNLQHCWRDPGRSDRTQLLIIFNANWNARMVILRVSDTVRIWTCCFIGLFGGCATLRAREIDKLLNPTRWEEGQAGISCSASTRPASSIGGRPVLPTTGANPLKSNQYGSRHATAHALSVPFAYPTQALLVDRAKEALLTFDIEHLLRLPLCM